MKYLFAIALLAVVAVMMFTPAAHACPPQGNGALALNGGCYVQQFRQPLQQVYVPQQLQQVYVQQVRVQQLNQHHAVQQLNVRPQRIRQRSFTRIR